ncbi:hypothetical protein AcW1_004323 [Taiwanofungus camphoratus]|nr:hypothetical protein AcW1_004323 [Antrodia cinnamomea]
MSSLCPDCHSHTSGYLNGSDLRHEALINIWRFQIPCNPISHKHNAIRVTQPEMSYTTITPAFTLFPTTTTPPNAFSIFATSQSPRETYVMHEDLRQALRPLNGRSLGRKKGSSASAFRLKKVFGMRRL